VGSIGACAAPWDANSSFNTTRGVSELRVAEEDRAFEPTMYQGDFLNGEDDYVSVCGVRCSASVPLGVTWVEWRVSHVGCRFEAAGAFHPFWIEAAMDWVAPR